MLFQVARVVELGVEELCGGCGWWWQWRQWLRVLQGSCVPEQREERSQSGQIAGLGEAVFMSARWASMSSTQLNDDFVLGIAFLLSSSATVCIFPISFSLLFLTSHTPSLAARFSTQSSRGMALGLSD